MQLMDQQEEKRKTVLAIRHVAFEDLGVFADVFTRRNYRIEYRDAGTWTIDLAEIVSADILVVLGGLRRDGLPGPHLNHVAIDLARGLGDRLHCVRIKGSLSSSCGRYRHEPNSQTMPDRTMDAISTAIGLFMTTVPIFAAVRRRKTGMSYLLFWRNPLSARYVALAAKNSAKKQPTLSRVMDRRLC